MLPMSAENDDCEKKGIMFRQDRNLYNERRVMFSVDHPYGSMLEARLFLDQIPVSAADRERIAHGNAERLFNL